MPYSLNLISYFPLLVNTYNLIFFIIAQIHYVFNTLSHHITKMLFFQYFFIKSRCNGERRVFLKHENPLKFKDFKILVKFWLCQSDVMLHIVMLRPTVAVMWCVPFHVPKAHFTHEAHITSEGNITFRLRNTSLKKALAFASAFSGSPNWARTSDIMINSHALYRLSYRGKQWCTSRDSNPGPTD